MARLWSSGFELNSTGAAVEWSAKFGTGATIQSTTARSGTYAARLTTLQSGSGNYFRRELTAADTSGLTYYARTHIRVDTYP